MEHDRNGRLDDLDNELSALVRARSSVEEQQDAFLSCKLEE